MRLLLPGMVLLALGACRPAAPGPIVASVIAGSPADHMRIGLVRFDRDGRIVPALALRWAILDGGRDYIFRIDDTPGHPPAAVVARMLRQALRTRAPRADAVPALVASVQAVTPTVVELRLLTPEPDLLVLLAQPDLALVRPGPSEPADDAKAPVDQTGDGRVVIRSERVGRAVARFRAGAAQFVGGGTFADLPVAQVAGLDPATIRFDPVSGLLGFAPVEGSPFADPTLVRALGLALDRERLVGAVNAPGLTTTARVDGSGQEAPLADRVAEARALVNGRGEPARVLRVAMPPGPGARLLFAQAARDWRRIGIDARAVPARAPADLVLVDRVAPSGSLLLLACMVSAGCDPRDPVGMAAPPFIAITIPVRWSLVARTLAGFHPNPLAAHPLDQLGAH